ncbi:MAG: energy-coupling factor transporter transmembrane protein EcfT [Clostridia bacterium]|nr:energy-coupling factor transporter transmembrane protein EcfT [Clostridia bacterium]MBQ4158010.1 energy-coupling factor transporter transmembrane protein EcfT [Clostridia bacterium]
MLSNITIGQYFPGTSFIHRLDPRTKILLTVMLIVCIFVSKGFMGFALIALFMLFCAKLSRISLKFIIRGLKPIAFIVSFTFILNLFLGAGTDVIWEWGVLSITKQGVRNAVYMAVRLVLLVTGTQLLTLTTSPIALTDGLERLFSPFKKIGFPAHELAMMMSIALRFIPTLIEETEKITKAQKARGADFESGNLLKRAKAMLPLLIPLFVGSFRRADDLAMAMEARCYRGGNGRTKMNPLTFAKIDLIAAGVFTALFAAIIVLNIFGIF